VAVGAVGDPGAPIPPEADLILLAADVIAPPIEAAAAASLDWEVTTVLFQDAVSLLLLATVRFTDSDILEDPVFED
jgi:hypothetical protein